MLSAGESQTPPPVQNTPLTALHYDARNGINNPFSEEKKNSTTRLAEDGEKENWTKSSASSLICLSAFYAA